MTQERKRSEQMKMKTKTKEEMIRKEKMIQNEKNDSWTYKRMTVEVAKTSREEEECREIQGQDDECWRRMEWI